MQTISRNTGRLVARVLDACGLIGCSLLVLAPLFAQCVGDVPVRGSDSLASASVAHFDGAQKPSPFYAARSEYFAGLTEVVVGHRSQLLVVAHRGRERDRGILGDQRRGSATRAAIRKSRAAINSVGDGGRDRRYASDCKESGLGLVARSSERRIAVRAGLDLRPHRDHEGADGSDPARVFDGVVAAFGFRLGPGASARSAISHKADLVFGARVYDKAAGIATGGLQ